MIVHYAAVGLLEQLQAKPELAVPALMNDFSSHDALLGKSVLVSLARFARNSCEKVAHIRKHIGFDSDGGVDRAAV